MQDNELIIGVLAMQGDFLEHQQILEKMGIKSIQVRTRHQLDQVSGLIIPGGESTTIGKLLKSYHLLEPLGEKLTGGMPAFGTCAGLVLLSGNVSDCMKGQPLIGLLSVDTCRNAYGRQVESFEADFPVPGIGDGDFHGVFIRAPIIEKIYPGVEVLARHGDRAVAVRQGNLLAASFHPELTDDHRFHRYFVEMVKESLNKNGKNK